jgi:hypothetical protein
LAVTFGMCLDGGIVNAQFGENPFVTFEAGRGAAVVARGEHASTLWVDQDDFPGVVPAAKDLQSDIECVTGVRPDLQTGMDVRGETLVLIGTIGKSHRIDDLISQGKLNVSGGSTPRLEYDFFIRSAGQVQVELEGAPSVDFQSGAGLQIAAALDDGAQRILKLDTWEQGNFSRAVAENVRRVTTPLTVQSAGRHALKVWMVAPGVVLEKILIDAGGLRPSYLGPPGAEYVSAAH